MRYGEFNIGPLEEIVLRAALSPSTGMAIKEHAENSLGRSLQRDALYQVLRRLVGKKFVCHNGLHPRNYWTTETGKEALENAAKSRSA